MASPYSASRNPWTNVNRVHHLVPYEAHLHSLLGGCPLASYAREQHLRYEGGQTIWVFAFDDSRISVREMRRLVVFSPSLVSG